MLKVLGQLSCAATTNETVYTVPAGKTAVVSTLAVCNRSGSSATYRVAIRVAGAALDNKQYLFYDVALAGGTDLYTIGLSLGEGDVVTFYSSAATMTVQLFGDES